MKKKAKEIINKSKDENKNKNETRYITVPNSNVNSYLDTFLLKAGIKIARTSGSKVGHLVTRSDNNPTNENSVVYKIPCKSCPSSYFGESGRGLNKRINEHKNDVKAHRTSNSIVIHVDKHGHLPDWNNTTVLNKGSSKKLRKTIEAAYINTNNNINHREGFICLAKATSLLIIKEYADKITSSPKRPIR